MSIELAAGILLIAVPIGLYVLHDATFVVSVLIFQVLVMSPLIFLGLGVERSSLLAPLRMPIVVASVLGLAMSALGWRLPEPVMRPLDLLGGAAVPLALFALGMSLNGSAVAWRRVAPVVTLKLLVQPLIAFLAGRFLLHLEGHALFAAVLFAGLPTAQNTHDIALRANPTVVARLTGANAASVRAVARTAASPDELPSPEELLRELSEVIGLEGTRIRFEEARYVPDAVIVDHE